MCTGVGKHLYVEQYVHVGNSSMNTKVQRKWTFICCMCGKSEERREDKSTFGLFTCLFWKDGFFLLAIFGFFSFFLSFALCVFVCFFWSPFPSPYISLHLFSYKVWLCFTHDMSCVSVSVTAVHRAGGLIVGQLDRVSFFESKADNENRLHILPLEGWLQPLVWGSVTFRHRRVGYIPLSEALLHSVMRVGYIP